MPPEIGVRPEVTPLPWLAMSGTAESAPLLVVLLVLGVACYWTYRRRT